MESTNVPLLDSDEIPAFEHVPGGPDAVFLLACDHASPRIPRRLGDLGVAASDLESHIAWDIGIAQVSRYLAEQLGAILVLQSYSRLVIDCNRPLGVADSIVQKSAGVAIKGNIGISEFERRQRVQAVFRPYHDCIEGILARRASEGKSTIYVAMHSFTPIFAGVPRPWHVGVLYQRDGRLGLPLLASLRDESDLVVGDNEPYRVTDQSDYSIVTYGEGMGLLHVELEIRQDLISAVSGQRQWADRLRRHLLSAAREAMRATSASIR